MPPLAHVILNGSLHRAAVINFACGQNTLGGADMRFFDFNALIGPDLVQFSLPTRIG